MLTLLSRYSTKGAVVGFLLSKSILTMYSKAFLKPYCEPSQPASLPLFQPQQVQGGRTDGYWIEAFPFAAGDNACPDLIGYGRGTKANKGDVQLFRNPYKSGLHG